ncbi:hypothetical protein BREVUG8_90033 [Brevundimonas sp. G8]|nr:hypothetical protein BREVUG8_90033 [Brevundimonas sp. G8]
MSSPDPAAEPSPPLYRHRLFLVLPPRLDGNFKPNRLIFRAGADARLLKPCDAPNIG